MKPRVLIVDDEFGLAEVMSEVLADRFDVSVAVNGEVALLCMNEKCPDLVLLDIMMPVMDGPTCLARMREHELLRRVPVVLMSAFASARPSDGAGYQGFLHKPFTFAQLLALIEPLLARSR